MTADGSMRVVVLGLLANLGIAAFKYFAAWMSGSASMLAEGHHSLADTANQALLLYGLKRARQGPSERHPFGYGKVQFFWSFVVALILFGVAGGLSLKGGILKILYPEPLESPLWSYAALAVGLVIEGGALRVSLNELRAKMADAGEMTLWGAFRDCTDAVVITAVMENFLAVVGLGIALAALPLATVLGWHAADGWASALIGLSLMSFAFMLAKELKSMLIGEGLPAHKLRRVRRAAEEDPSVRRVIYMKTLVTGPDDALVAVKAEFDPSLDARGIETAVDRIEARVRETIPAAVCFIEPGR